MITILKLISMRLWIKLNSYIMSFYCTQFQIKSKILKVNFKLCIYDWISTFNDLTLGFINNCGEGGIVILGLGEIVQKLLQ